VTLVRPRFSPSRVSSPMRHKCAGCFVISPAQPLGAPAPQRVDAPLFFPQVERVRISTLGELFLLHIDLGLLCPSRRLSDGPHQCFSLVPFLRRLVLPGGAWYRAPWSAAFPFGVFSA